MNTATDSTVDVNRYGEPTQAGNGVLSVVIPALNEEEGIAEIVDRVKAASERLREEGIEETEILVVDDGSDDRTSAIANAMTGVRVVRHETNRGYGAAIKTGFCHARGDFLVFLDADGTYPPESLPALCRVAIEEKADIVVGSRRSGGDSRMPAMRRVGNFLWSHLVSLLGEARCVDPASGMRVLRRTALPLLYPLPDGLNFTPVMSTRALHEGLRVVEIPIPYCERVGRSKLSVIHDGMRFLKTILWTALEYNPAKVLGVAGMLMVFVAMLLGLGLVSLRLSGVSALGVWGVFTVFAILMLSVGGLSVYSLGVTFNHIVCRFNRQPMRVGLFRGRVLERWIEPQFGWLGTASVAVGVIMSVVSLIAGGENWDIRRVWLWLLGSALFMLVGSQLLILWLVARVTDRLSTRAAMINQDLGTGCNL